jgi:MFS transporter, NNP family, nitrate/nitrite transporter
LLPPLLFAGVHALTHTYSMAWILLAAVLLAAAVYVGTHGLYIGLGLAVTFEPEPSPTRMTVAILGDSDTRWGAAAIVSRLAELAASDELVVVYGTDDRAGSRLSPHALAAGLRDRLPRHSVVVVGIARDPAVLGRDALLLGEYVEAGTLAIAVTPRAADPRSVAAELSIYLQADRALMVSYTTADGAELQPV